MSDLAALLVMGGLLGAVLILGVLVVSARRRDHLRQEEEPQEEIRTLDPGIER